MVDILVEGDGQRLKRKEKAMTNKICVAGLILAVLYFGLGIARAVVKGDFPPVINTTNDIAQIEYTLWVYPERGVRISYNNHCTVSSFDGRIGKIMIYDGKEEFKEIIP